jgi:hypothetical protein
MDLYIFLHWELLDRIALVPAMMEAAALHLRDYHLEAVV